METVQPIRDKRQIDAMKRTLGGRDRLLFILGINTGLRISDLLALSVGNVRGKDSLTLREKKTNKAKTFRFNDAAITAINTLIPAESTDYTPLFPSRSGNRAITRVQAYRILNNAANNVGITDSIGCHTLRKTFGYHAYKAGVDLTLLQAIFNHASQRVTLRYIGVVQDDIDNVYAAVNL